MNQREVLNKLKHIIDISSPYAPTPDSDINKNNKLMIEIITDIENSTPILDEILHYYLGLAYKNYCAWFIRGNERIFYLHKIVEHLETSISCNNQYTESKVELARILIEEKSIRNLEKALQLIEELKFEKSLPSWMNSLVEKAKRWSGDIEVPVDCNFKTLDPTPAVLREERTKLRKLLSKLQKTNEPSQKMVAKRLYNLALFVAHLYGSHDCNSGVIGYQYDQAAKTAKKISNKFNFDYLGIIIEGKFLSETDYKKIEKAVGPSNSTITIEKIKNLTTAST